MTGFLILVVLPITLAIISYGISLYENWREEAARRQADIIYRAESQHARLMDGDESALYGNYPPADL